MKGLTHLTLVLAAVVLLSACDDMSRSQFIPTGPSAISPPTPPPPPPAVNGEIGLSSLAPEPGSIVGVFDCDPGLPSTRSRPAHVIGICTYELRMTFDVVVDRDISDARLTVDFRSGDQRCAFASTGKSLLAGATRTSMTVAEVVLSDDPNISQPCAFPATTDRIIVELIGKGGGLVSREFPYSYTFAMRE